MLKHDEFRKGGRVSVWVGNFASETELDDYMNVQRAFETDFGFEIDERDVPETAVAEKTIPVLELINGFSWSESYAESVNQLAKEKGLEQASTMIVFINFAYLPERAKPDPNALLQFLGVVDFGGVA